MDHTIDLVSQHASSERVGRFRNCGGMVRVGPVHYNTLEEVERFGEVLRKIAAGKV